MSPGTFIILVFAIFILTPIIIIFMKKQEDKGNNPTQELVIRIIVIWLLFSFLVYLIKC